MCGISGFIQEAAPDEGLLVRMNDTLTHRGPDASGTYEEAAVHLGHRRLSILDLEASRQPMRSEDESVILSYNGELYNYRSLREQLQREGHRFHTQGDTEVLLRAYEAWGEDCLGRLQGMFAFALWDGKRRRLLLARDPLGVKPLYYAHSGGHLLFASEIKALLEHPAVSRELDLEAMALYLECQFIPAPRTIYRSIRKLPAASALSWEGGQLRQWCYWQMDYRDKLELSEEELVAETERQLRTSVESMLVSDVPLGVFLSGGIDSSLVAAIMADLCPSKVHAFNVGFAEGRGAKSEHEEARIVADHIGCELHQEMARPANLLSRLETLTHIFDEPFGDTAVIPTLLLAEFTRKQVTVALTGEGADELFAGYTNYEKRLRDEQLTRWLGSPFSPLHYLAKALPGPLRRDRFISALGRSKAERYTTIPNIFHESTHASLFGQGFRTQVSERLRDYARQQYEDCNSAEYLEKLLHIDTQLWLPDNLLVKVDRATMAHSLEARVPYLDHRFVEFVARVPGAYKQRGKTQKYLLKKVAEKYLPERIIYRKKQGFVMPVKEWLMHDLREYSEGVLLESFAKRGILREAPLRAVVGEHMSGKKNHSFRLWALLMLELWLARYDADFRV